jgi:hypothetical protein
MHQLLMACLVCCGSTPVIQAAFAYLRMLCYRRPMFSTIDSSPAQAHRVSGLPGKLLHFQNLVALCRGTRVETDLHKQEQMQSVVL